MREHLHLVGSDTPPDSPWIPGIIAPIANYFKTHKRTHGGSLPTPTPDPYAECRSRHPSSYPDEPTVRRLAPVPRHPWDQYDPSKMTGPPTIHAPRARDL